MNYHLSKQSQRWFWPVVCAVALVAASFSLWIGMHQSIWFDEAYSILVAKQPVDEAVRLASVDTHPPFYYVLLHGWGELFNWDILALRLLGITAFGSAIIVAAALVRKMFGVRAAIWAAVLIGISPLIVRYSFEIRMYSLASLIGVAATYCMVCAHNAKGKRRLVMWAGYAILVMVGMYTLYYLAFLWLAHLTWLLYIAWRDGALRRTYTQPWMWAYTASVIPFLPWLPTFFKQMNNGALAPIGQQMNLENIMGIMTFNSLYRPVWQLDIWLTFLVLALFGAVTYITRVALANISSTREKHYLVLIALYVGVPIFVLMLLSFSRSMYVERYLSHVAIGISILIASLIAYSLRTPSARLYAAIATVMVTVFVGLTHVSNIGNFNFQRMSRPELAQATLDMGECKSGTTVVAADPYVYIELTAYLPANCDLHFYNQWDHLGGGYAPLDGSSRQFRTKTISGADSLYYVYYDQPKLVADPTYRSDSVDVYGNLSVAKYTRKSSAE